MCSTTRNSPTSSPDSRAIRLKCWCMPSRSRPMNCLPSRRPTCSAEAFCQSLTVSAHSLCKTVRFAKPHLREWGSVITLTYQASERAEASYGLMGVSKSALESAVRYLALELGPKKIRVNALSPGPIETVAATGIMGAFLRNPEALERQRARAFQEAIEMARAENHPDPLAVASAAWKHFQEHRGQALRDRGNRLQGRRGGFRALPGQRLLAQDHRPGHSHRLRSFHGQRCLTRSDPDRSVPAAPSAAHLADRARQLRLGGVAAQVLPGALPRLPRFLHRGQDRRPHRRLCGGVRGEAQRGDRVPRRPSGLSQAGRGRCPHALHAARRWARRASGAWS